MRKKLVNSFYIVASLIMVISQLGIVNVFAVTTDTVTPSMSIRANEANVGEEVSIDVTASQEELSQLVLVRDPAIEEVTREVVDATHVRLHVKATAAGEFDIYGQLADRQTNGVHLSVAAEADTSNLVNSSEEQPIISTESQTETSQIVEETAVEETAVEIPNVDNSAVEETTAEEMTTEETASSLTATTETESTETEHSIETEQSATKETADSKSTDSTEPEKSIDTKTKNPFAVGDDPGVIITSPDTITTNQNVELDVILQGSAGKLNENGTILISIPKEIVRNPSSLGDPENYTIGGPFSLGNPIYTDDGKGHYIVTINYDASKIDQSEAFGAMVKIHFQAPLIREDMPDQTFTADMTQGAVRSHSEDSSEIIKTNHSTGIFYKWSPNKRKDVDGVNSAIMDVNNSYKNVFAVSVNYTQQNLHNVVVKDVFPEGTSLADSTTYQDASGDSTIINHLRVLKVTATDEEGIPNAWEYVTQEFKDKIKLVDNGFEVDFGDLTPDDSYELVYGLSVDEPFDGVKQNAATMTSDEHNMGAHENITLDNDEFQNVTLLKNVDQHGLMSTEGTLTYTLDLHDRAGIVAKGTKIQDPFAAQLTDPSNFQFDPAEVTTPVYDQATHTLSYELLKDMHEDDHVIVKFDAVIDQNAGLQAGDKILNKASFNYGGTNIYSNDVTTAFKNSVALRKVDSKTGEPLQGAVIEIKDSLGAVVETLTTDAKGAASAGLLKPGEYTAAEKTAPAGYVLDTTPKSFKVIKGMNTVVSLKFEDTLTPGSVVLTKVDDKTGDALQGAVFELQDADGMIIQSELTTDASGKITVDGLAPGDYQFTETQAPKDYELDATPVIFTIEKGQTKELEISMKNKLTTGGVILTKTDDKSGQTLQGAVFELQDNAGKAIQNGLLTDASGKIAVDGLAPGDYQFVETQAPTGYELEATPVTFTIDKGQTKAVEVSMKNKLTPGGVVLTKTDNTSGEVLQGAVFELQDKAGKVIQSGLLTDASGKIAVDGLAPGDYQFVETQAPTGYDLDATPVTFTIEKGQTSVVQVAMTNQLTPGGVILTKTDDTSGEVLQGAVFDLQDTDGNTLQSGLTTDDSGKIAVDNLMPGDYQFVETTAPTGYDLDATPVTFTIEKGQTESVQLSMVNKLTPGGVILTKIDDKNGEVLQGAIFELQDQAGNAIQSDLTTDASGKIAIDGLAPGDYQFVETTAPTGYDLDATPVTFTIEKGQTEAVQISMANTLTSGGVILTKTDAKSGETLQDAVFDLQDQAGKVIQSGLTTDVSGKIAVDNLAPGDYQFVETQAPTGYELDATPVTFTIEKGQTEAVQIAMVNQLTPGDVVLTKTDNKSGEALQGAVFELQDQAGKAIQSGLITDDAGQIAVDNLAPGDYQFVETQAPSGYELDATPVTFTIEKGQTAAVEVEMTNNLTPGGVTLTKTDAKSGEVLQGAVFELQDQAGKALQSGLITDTSGKLAVDGLIPGDYQFVETQAPTGYELDATPVTFTIEKGQTSAVEVEMTNNLTPGGVILTKTDVKSGEALQGAVFELQDQAGKAIQSGLVTDATGKLAVDGLTPGDYQFVETTAPTGYELNATPVTFTIKKGQTAAIEVEMTNNLTPGGAVLSKIDGTSGAVLQGAVFELQDANGNTLQSGLTTDVSGKLAVDGLAPGDYQFVETQAPTGYELDATPVTFTIEKGQISAVEVEMVNRLTPGGVVLSKIDGTNGEVLQGAVFELQDADGNSLQSGLTTDASGKLFVDGLTPGDYQFVETQAPTGYELDATPVTFTIEKGQTEAVQVSMTNELTPGGVILTKTDAKNGEVLQGAVFELQDNVGKAIQSGLTTDASGKLAVDGLAPGDYQFVETQAPTGYDLDATPLTFTIEKGQTAAVKVEMVNRLTPGGVVLSKTDSKDGTPLQSVVFELQDSTGKVLQRNLVTDSAGKLAVDNLAPGDYQFVETQAPTGYELDATPVTFTIKKGQTEAVQVTMTNHKIKGSVILQKYDKKTGNVLAGAIFELQNADHKVVISELKTDETGKLVVKEMTPGTYYFVETKAPAGYTIDKTPIKFIVEEKEANATVKMANEGKKHAVKVIKKDTATKQVLKGAEFSLFDKTGKVIQKNITTNETGTFALEDLAVGDYYLKETTAPKGYKLDKRSISFSIKEDSELVSLDIYNAKEKDTPPVPVEDNPHSTGKLPKTGEKQEIGLSSLGVLVLVFIGGVYYHKRRIKK
ncbi:hypothetical protein BAU15_08790 [Enterococcus sp. JM4C]|uniref:SpaA isopeptide-forming pilin-related protein n=1 Tax=Candidatus Enterococcus huntleyi TaxID=1857217 RepID=UPI00137B7319|nr:SpaA isopeptide-forming pilin-related protein [Enterococcus sp. JM4C]KAF1296733.1 hypothetical protein BAU15_08790 [Enterococcus sp. JM4C]